MTAESVAPPLMLGRYSLHGEIASGGMATVHYGRLVGEKGFVRMVAIKKLHPHIAKDPKFVAMFIDEARIASRIRHPNVVPTLDVIEHENTLYLVMEFVHGLSLSHVLRLAAKREVHVPPRVVVAIMAGVLRGLQAAHEARDERGNLFGIVHRDVSPQNVIVGADGLARVVDFGIAKAVDRLQTTAEGQVKGKLSYMAPEQVRGEPATSRSDLHGAAVLLWEGLAGRPLFDGANQAAILDQILSGRVPAPSSCAPDVPATLDDVVLRGLQKSPSKRYATAREMALALEASVPPASPSEVGAFLRSIAEDVLAEQERQIACVEAAPDDAITAGGAVRPRARWQPRLIGLIVGAGLLSGVVALGLARRTPPVAAEVLVETPKGIESPKGQVEAKPEPLLPASSFSPFADPPAKRSKTNPKRSPAGTAANRSCTPPYYFDAQGDKQYKVECLR